MQVISFNRLNILNNICRGLCELVQQGVCHTVTFAIYN
jgi:hypothetical protein